MVSSCVVLTTMNPCLYRLGN